MKLTTVERRLKRFLNRVEKRLSDLKKNEDVCYKALYHIVNISEALTKGDENIIASLSSWVEDNKEKFHFCTTEDDFHKMISKIKKSTDQIMNAETSAGQDDRTDLNEHLHSLIELIPDKKEI